MLIFINSSDVIYYEKHIDMDLLNEVPCKDLITCDIITKFSKNIEFLILILFKLIAPRSISNTYELSFTTSSVWFQNIFNMLSTLVIFAS